MKDRHLPRRRKRVREVPDVRNRHIRLLSRNERHGPIEIRDRSDFELIGIVVGRAGAPVP